MSIQFILENAIIYLLGFRNEARLKDGRDGNQLRSMDSLHRCGYGGVAVCVHVCVCVRVLHRGPATVVSGSALRVKLMDKRFSQTDDALHPCRSVVQEVPGHSCSHSPVFHLWHLFSD